MSYNGWTNYETWNVNLWIENDEPLYREKVAWIRAAGNTPITGSDVREFVRCNMGGKTPDLRDKPGSMLKVNWDEIAAHWEDERKERED